MHETPLVSVIIPAYNASDYIYDTIKSILNQTYSNLEVIVINDGSTDNTEFVIKKMMDEDNRIKLICTENLGAGHARNIGIRNSNGQYIRFCDSDDLFPPDSTKMLIEEIVNYDTDMAMGPLHFLFDDKSHRIPNPHKKIYKKNEYIETDPINNISLGENASVCNKIYKKSFLINNDIFFPEGLIAEDIVFSFNCYMSASKIAILSIDQIVYFWKVRPGSVSRSGPTDKYTSDRIKIANIMEDTIENSGKNGLLIDRIRKRNINSILDLISNRDKFLTESQFHDYKQYLNRLIRKKFNVTFHKSTENIFILLLILNNDYNKALKLYSTLYSPDLSVFEGEKVKCDTLGNSIKPPTAGRDYFSNWTNRDLVIFHINVSTKGLYDISITYSWNSGKTDSYIRKGVLIVGSREYIVHFTRTKTWTQFKVTSVLVNIEEKGDIQCILKPINESGVGFINLKSIYYNLIK